MAARIQPITFESRHILSSRHLPRLQALAASNMVPSRLAEIPPIFMTADLTWECNYRCKGCIDRSVAFRMDNLSMPWNIAHDILDYSRDKKVEGMMVMGGEVSLYEHFDEFLKQASDMGMAVSIVSNGSRMDRHVDALVAVAKIAASSIRVSVNQYGDKYKAHTQGDASFEQIMANLKTLSSYGLRVLISTVIFGEAAAKKVETRNNVFDIENMAASLRDAGVSTHLLIPGRDPDMKTMFPLTTAEREEMDRIKAMDWSPMRFGIAGLFDRAGTKPRKFTVCPSSLLRVLVGADGTLYTCTDSRGVEAAIIGKIDTEHRFADVWHSEDRVRKQMEFAGRYLCGDHICLRDDANNTLDDLLHGRISLDDIELTDSINPFF